MTPVAGAVEYTDCISAEGVKTPPHPHTHMSVLDMMQKQSDEISVMQEDRVTLHCHCSQVHSCLEWVAPDRVLSMDQIEMFDI